MDYEKNSLFLVLQSPASIVKMPAIAGSRLLFSTLVSKPKGGPLSAAGNNPTLTNELYIYGRLTSLNYVINRFVDLRIVFLTNPSTHERCMLDTGHLF